MGFPIALIILFLINPLITLFLGFIFLCTFSGNRLLWQKKDEIIVLKTLCVCCILFVSGMNSQKIPESDLFVYMRQYHLAAHASLMKYLSINHFKEPVYYTLTWLLNRLLFNNELLFKFVISVCCYFFLNVAFYKFCKSLRVSVRLTLFGIFVMCFTPYIFTTSMHLLRQYLAGAILMYVLVDWCFYNKKDWLLLIAMGLIHSTTFFFIPFLFFKSLGRPFKKNTYLYILSFTLLISIQFLASFLYTLGFFNQTLGYALKRASQNTTFNLGDMSVTGVSLLLIITCSSWYIAYKPIVRFHDSIKPGLKHFFNILIILCIFVLLNLHQSELSIRFMFFTYFFFPFIVIILLKEHPIPSTFYSIGIIPLILFWIYYLSHGTWEYKGSADIWIAPFYSYFLPS